MEHIQILDTIPKTCLVLTQRIYTGIYTFVINGTNFYPQYFTVYSGTITTSNLVSGTDYSIDSDPTTGNTRIKNLKSSTIQGNYNNLAIIWNELSRRIYPVIRDPNTIKLTDGTHNITMSSTSSHFIKLISWTMYRYKYIKSIKWSIITI